jgi:hypothetical protein
MTDTGSSGIVAVPEQRQTKGTWLDQENGMEKKKSNILRIGFNNINGFSNNNNNDYNNNLRSFISQYEFDLFGMSEININWNRSPIQVKDCTRGWFSRLQISYGHFSEFPGTSAFQVGGVMQFAINDLTARIQTTGNDRSGLGRWTWQTLRGKQGRVVRVVTAYRPVKNEAGIGSTWNQHQFHADMNNRDGNPHEQWIKDLSEEIAVWRESGDSIILMVDLNDDVNTSKTAKALQKVGLREIITKSRQSTTPTYQRGSTTIDGIFVSQEIIPTQCGYLKSTSDHLCVWLDVEKKALLDLDPNVGPSKQIRRLQCTDPRTIEKYNNSLWSMVKKEGIIEQINAIYGNAPLGCRDNQVLWEEIDKKLTAARLKAEKTCRKIKAGNIQWSPELAMLRVQKKFGTLALKRQSKKKVKGDTKFFRKIARLAQINHQHGLNRTEVEIKIKNINKQLQKYRQNHREIRSSWLESLAVALAQADSRTTSENNEVKRLAYLKQLRQRESQRLSARIIKNVTKEGNYFQQVDHVDFDNNVGDVTTTYCKEKIEEELLLENQRRFNQAAETPFLCPPLVEKVGKYAETEFTNTILDNGITFRDASNQHVKDVLNAMKRPQNYNPIQIDTSVETFKKGWLKSKESTAAGRSGLHFGHFIAACKHEGLANMECQMANFPLLSGYSPLRWQTGIEVMLLKKKDNFHVSKLRAILLFEADFNFNNKRIGRSLMWNAEDNSWVAPEQYGSRKGHSAIDHCLNKRLSFDILRQYKQPGAICINDMKSCYDRIVHSVAAICMRRWGLDKEALRMMFYTLQQLKHHVRTAYGLSSIYFKANQVNQTAIQGIGQGNGAGPQIWAAISTVILDMLRAQKIGGDFEAPIE